MMKMTKYCILVGITFVDKTANMTTSAIRNAISDRNGLLFTVAPIKAEIGIPVKMEARKMSLRLGSSSNRV
jgi:hypothetical protein